MKTNVPAKRWGGWPGLPPAWRRSARQSLDVHNWVDRRCIRLMEWNGSMATTSHLLSQDARVAPGPRQLRRWKHINEVIITAGPGTPTRQAGRGHRHHPRLRRRWPPSIATNIVHGDIKPVEHHAEADGQRENVDIGSAFRSTTSPPGGPAPRPTPHRKCSKGANATPAPTWQAWATCSSRCWPAAAVRRQDRLPGVAGGETVPRPAASTCCRRPLISSELLMSFLRQLIAPRPDAAVPSRRGRGRAPGWRAAFHRQLVIGDLASEYDHEMRLWLEELEDA